MSHEANKAIVRRLMDEDISGGDLSVADEIIHPDFFDHTNPPGLQRGIEGHKGVVTLFRTAFPDLRFAIDDLVAEGDRVVARTTMSGTHLTQTVRLHDAGFAILVTRLVFKQSALKARAQWQASLRNIKLILEEDEPARPAERLAHA